MAILVINCGSTSVKMAVVDPKTGDRLAESKVDRLESADDAHAKAIAASLPQLVQSLDGAKVEAVGHRVVHGGNVFPQATLIDDSVEASIDVLSKLAPLHNPVNLAGIQAARRQLPDVPHVAVFDTSFHATLPTRAKQYAIDRELAKKHSVRRFGFHGTSHQLSLIHI